LLSDLLSIINEMHSNGDGRVVFDDFVECLVRNTKGLNLSSVKRRTLRRLVELRHELYEPKVRIGM
jgi:hypothetical protein